MGNFSAKQEFRTRKFALKYTQCSHIFSVKTPFTSYQTTPRQVVHTRSFISWIPILNLSPGFCSETQSQKNIKRKGGLQLFRFVG